MNHEWCQKFPGKAALARRMFKIRGPRMRPTKKDPRLKISKLLFQKYGITLEEYEKILESQGGRCALCGRPNDKKKRMPVEHCHRTGQVRGIVCNPCNVCIIPFFESMGLQSGIEAISRYLS